MIYELIPWRTLSRMAIPALKVARRPLVIGEVTVPVGATFDPQLFPLKIRAERLRQFYESRLLEPVDAPLDSRQFYREQLKQRGGPQTLGEILTQEEIAPVAPVASRIVADLPSVPVAAAKSNPKGRR